MKAILVAFRGSEKGAIKYLIFAFLQPSQRIDGEHISAYFTFIHSKLIIFYHTQGCPTPSANKSDISFYKFVQKRLCARFGRMESPWTENWVRKEASVGFKVIDPKPNSMAHALF